VTATGADRHVGIMVLQSLMIMVWYIYISTNVASLRHRTSIPSAMADSFSDCSSIRIKVARYTVDKKLQELESKDPQVKIGDWEYLQALPRYGIYEPEPESESESAQQGDDSALLQGVDEPLELPPLIPTHPDASNISWSNLLKGLKDGVLDAKPSVPPESRKPKFPPDHLVYPPWYYVAIIGAGVAGLRTAKLLQDKGIPYKIFEASNRPGGRLFTYHFSPEENDYYDVGAMRFPKNDANKRTFELFDELGLTRDGKVVDYVFSNDDNIRFYNSEC
jgi:Flavin containing amine oxidoreductase